MAHAVGMGSIAHAVSYAWPTVVGPAYICSLGWIHTVLIPYKVSQRPGWDLNGLDDLSVDDLDDLDYISVSVDDLDKLDDVFVDDLHDLLPVL